MNPQHYIPRFYEAAKAKGFYDETWNITTEKALIITEIAEAINADRKNKRANVAYFKERFAEIEKSTTDAEYLEKVFVRMYKHYIKDTVEDKIAGAMGRIFGLMEKGNFYNERYFLRGLKHYQEQTDLLFPEVMYFAIVSTTEGSVNYTLALLTLISEKEGIDIEWHLEQALRFNKTRPRKHGCKY